jgi:hypothetical protein
MYRKLTKHRSTITDLILFRKTERSNINQQCLNEPNCSEIFDVLTVFLHENVILEKVEKIRMKLNNREKKS